MIFVAMAAAPLHLEKMRRAVEGANLEVGWQHKELADHMGFPSPKRVGLYYRQLRTHGLNFNLLLNAGPRWILAFLVCICHALGITKQQVATAFGLAFMTEVELERERAVRAKRDRAIERRLRRLEQLAGVPAPVIDPPAENESADAGDAKAARMDPGDRPDARAAVATADVHLLPVQVSLQMAPAVRDRLDL